jgi:hypothetical protein
MPLSSTSANFLPIQDKYPSIPMSYSSSTSGSPSGTGTPTLGLAESSMGTIPVRHLREDCHTRYPTAVLLWHYFTCYPTFAG